MRIQAKLQRAAGGAGRTAATLCVLALFAASCTTLAAAQPRTPLAVEGEDDPYALLGVARDATASDIRRAYRRLAKSMHPDTSAASASSAVDEERFQRVARAYEILSDESKRRAHDLGKFTNRWEFEQAAAQSGRATDSAHAGLFAADSAVVSWHPGDVAYKLEHRTQPTLVMFYATWCVHCQQFAPEYRRVALELADTHAVVAVNCHVAEEFCAQQQIGGYPTLRLYPMPATEAHEQWSTVLNSADAVVTWARELLSSESALVSITSKEQFHRLVMSNSSLWLVCFTAGAWCPPCTHMRSVLRRAAMQHPRIRFGTVDCDANRPLCEHMHVGMFPMSRLFLGSPAEKARRESGRGIDIQIPQDALSFPPAAGLDLALRIMDAVADMSVRRRSGTAPAPPTQAAAHDDL